MNLQIHLANSFDKEKLVELQSNSIRLLSIGYEPKAIESLVISQANARLTSKDEIVVVALDKDKLVGFACLNIYLSQITGLYVHPNFIRQGIGTQLLNFIEKIAQKSGCRIIQVWSSLTAANFYKSQGFEVINDSGFFTEYNIWIPCIYLEKELLYKPSLPSQISSVVRLVITILVSCFLIVQIGEVLVILRNRVLTTPIPTLPERPLTKE